MSVKPSVSWQGDSRCCCVAAFNPFSSIIILITYCRMRIDGLVLLLTLLAPISPNPASKSGRLDKESRSPSPRLIDYLKFHHEGHQGGRLVCLCVFMDVEVLISH